MFHSVPQGMTRRHFMSHLAGASALTIPALTLGQSIRANANVLKSNRKSAILLWMGGGPSTIDLFDLKPGASTGGPFRPIATTGDMQICEHLPQLAQQCGELLQQDPEAAAQFAPLMRALFHGLGLTPYVPIEARLTILLDEEFRRREAQGNTDGLGELVELVAFMLLQLARHLAAFDLRLFHNFGADYPDLLLLDALLGMYDRWFERKPDLFLNQSSEMAPRLLRLKARRRVAWLLGSLLRQEHEGLRVPEAPTSPGENQRVLPEPLVHVDDAEIMDPRLRRKRLFADQPWNARRTECHAELVYAATGDLQNPRVMQWLGEALFLDRPLGVHRPLEVIDDTPLVSYLAFSRTLAQSRLRQMHASNWLDNAAFEDLRKRLAQLVVAGVPAAEVPGEPRLGVVSLADARLIVPDFIFMRTTRSSLHELLASGLLPLHDLDEATVQWLATGRNVLLIRTAAKQRNDTCLTAFDAAMKVRTQFVVPSERISE